jgi:hypothetical protein
MSGSLVRSTRTTPPQAGPISPSSGTTVPLDGRPASQLAVSVMP